jgi:hypothetical protein
LEVLASLPRASLKTDIGMGKKKIESSNQKVDVFMLETNDRRCPESHPFRFSWGFIKLLTNRKEKN